MKSLGKFFRRILLGMNVVAAILLLLSAYSPYINPHTHSVWSCVGLFFPLFLIANLAFMLLWLLFYRRYVLLPLLVFVCCWGTIHTYIPVNWPGGDVPEDAIKVLSYNTQAFGQKENHTRENPNEVLEYLQKSDADIICLQEYIWGNQLKKKDIDYALRGYRYRHYQPLGKGLNGLGCYSRYPILSAVPVPYESNRNGSVAYYIKVKEDTLLVINNHLESNKILESDVETYRHMVETPEGREVLSGSWGLLKKLGEANAIRAGQVDKLAEKLGKADTRHVIVCGDFNDTPVSYTHRVLGEHLKDAFVESGNGLGISYNQHRLYFRIDHILVSEAIKVYKCVVDDTSKASDHYPIWCAVSLK